MIVTAGDPFTARMIEILEQSECFSQFLQGDAWKYFIR
jgi:hypothetical protein